MFQNNYKYQHLKFKYNLEKKSFIWALPDFEDLFDFFFIVRRGGDDE